VETKEPHNALQIRAAAARTRWVQRPLTLDISYVLLLIS
jgi:hypothetical protein